MRMTHDDDCAGDCKSCSMLGSCPDRLVCRCLKVTEEQVIATIRIHEVRNLVELRQVSEAGTGCNCCHRELKAYLNVYSSRNRTSELSLAEA